MHEVLNGLGYLNLNELRIVQKQIAANIAVKVEQKRLAKSLWNNDLVRATTKICNQIMTNGSEEIGHPHG